MTMCETAMTKNLGGKRENGDLPRLGTDEKRKAYIFAARQAWHEARRR
jgi:hypothetical protein